MSSDTALITGGASGIGLATARLLVSRGVPVVVADVAAPPSDLDATFVSMDVTDAAAWSALVTQHGPFRFAFLNAGVASRVYDVCEVDVAEIERVLRIDIDGVILGTHAVAPGMVAAGEGSIVCTASLAGLLAFAPDPVYTAAKHAVVGWVRGVAPQLGDRGVHINAVCPGVTDTPILTDEMRHDLAEASFPMMPAAQIAEAVLERFDGSETGGAYVCQPGREALRFQFRGVPGPAGGAGRPPAVLAERS